MIFLRNCSTICRGVFLQYDSGHYANEKFIISASSFKINILKKIRVFLINGTFRSANCRFCQIFKYMENLLENKPIVLYLMTDKNRDLYCNCFKKTNELFNLSPEVILTDLEKALLSSTKDAFIGVTNYICNFHFGKIIWKIIQN